MNAVQARKLVRISWIVAVAGALFGPVFSFAEPTIRQETDLTTVVLIVPLGAYAFWALFWGIVGLAKHWKGNVRRIGFVSSRLQPLHDRMSRDLGVFRAVVQMAAAAVFAIECIAYFTLMLAASYLYGLLGGGIYQFVRHQKAARLESLPAREAIQVQ